MGPLMTVFEADGGILSQVPEAWLRPWRPVGEPNGSHCAKIDWEKSSSSTMSAVI